jgi:hypothetical protein
LRGAAHLWIGIGHRGTKEDSSSFSFWKMLLNKITENGTSALQMRPGYNVSKYQRKTLFFFSHTI